MPYVMVPVPEEHVQDVMQFILREVARASLEPWDEDAISTLFHDIEEEGRSLIAYVARAIASGKEISEAEVAALLQLRPREMAGLVRDINERAAQANRPNLVFARMVSETQPNGRTTEKRVLAMSDELAPLVREAERADSPTRRRPRGDRAG